MMSSTLPEINYDIERLAVKTVCAADVLVTTVEIAEQLQKLQGKVNRYVRQAELIVTWKRGSGVFTMVGSAAKTAGGVMVLAAPLHPKLSLAVTAGHRLWKMGTGLKVMTAIGGMLRELWHSGCRKTLVEFTRCVALLTRNVGVFQELIMDLQGTTDQLNLVNNNNFQAPEEVVHALSQFLPAQQIGYATHVMNIVFGNHHYSPLFDFISMTSDPSNESDLFQVIREIEGFRFTEFAEESDAKALVTISSFLHVSRELLDFLDGFQKVTDKDCRFLQSCLSKFTEESTGILKVVTLLTGLCRLKQSLKPAKKDSNKDLSKRTESIPKPVCENIEIPGTDLKEHSDIQTKKMCSKAETQPHSVSSDSRDRSHSDKVTDPTTDQPVSQSKASIGTADIASHSKDFILKTVSFAFEKGSSLFTRKRRRSNEEEQSQFSQGQECLNKL